jgi:hypothetical protein
VFEDFAIKETVSLTPGSDGGLISGEAPVTVTFLKAASAAERGSLGRRDITPSPHLSLGSLLDSSAIQ